MSFVSTHAFGRGDTLISGYFRRKVRCVKEKTQRFWGDRCFGRYHDPAMSGTCTISYIHCEEFATANDAAISGKNRDTKLVLQKGFSPLYIDQDKTSIVSRLFPDVAL